MKILFLLQEFQPEPNIFYGLPFAREMARRGHHVQVLTGFPNYPNGKVFEGYRIKLLQKEIMEEIPVYRVPLYPSHDRSSLKRTCCYSSLALSQAVIGPWIVKSADVAYVAQGPATLGIPAVVLKWLRKIPFVYNIQDLWPDSLPSTGMFNNRWGLNILHHWCRFVYKRASRVVVIAPGMKKTLIERGVPEEKIQVIYNWCDESMMIHDKPDKHLAAELGFLGKFNIVFAGNMGTAQSLDTVLHAAQIIQKKELPIQFVLIGSGVETDHLKSLARSLNLQNVLFLPRRPTSEIGPVLRLADVLLVHLKDDPLFRITIPSKIQSYMAIGRPLLVGVSGDAADLVKQARAGLACLPENPESMAQQVQAFYSMADEERESMGTQAMQWYAQNLSFPSAADRYETLFQEVTNEHRRRKTGNRV